MQTVYSGLTKFALELGVNLKDFNNAIEKSADTIVSTRQKLDKTAKEYDAEVAEMKKHYFGANKKIAENYEKFIDEKKKLLEEEFEETRKEERKNIIKQSFKDESKKNEIKFIDNKWSKGNNLLNTSNEYYTQLEKLKSDSLEVYGEDFQNRNEYKKALMNLNDEYAKNMKDAWKEDFKENHKVIGGIANGIKDTFERNKETLQGLLGPLNLFIEPLKGFFGGFGTIFNFISGGIKTIFGKFTKKNPTASDVLKSGAFGVGALYIGSKLEQMFGKTKGKNDELKLDKIKNLFGKGGLFSGGIMGLGKSSALKGVIGNASKMAGPLAIATALIMMIIDAIKGVFKSKEWGVSKVSGALGSFLGGASEGGLKNMFASMGKWALLGAGIGSVVPVVGTIAGGLIGGAIGAILGIIGGKNIAIGFDKMGSKIKDWFINVMLASIKEPFILLKNNINEIWKSDMSIGKKIGKIVGEIIMYPINSAKSYFIKNKKFFSNLLGKSKDFKKSIAQFSVSIIDGFKNFDFKKSMSKLGQNFDNIWSKVFTFGEDVWEGIKESTIGQFVSSILDKIKNKFGEWLGKIKESPVGKFVEDLFSKISDGMTKFFNENPVGVWVKSSIITPIQKALGTIGDFFGFISDNWDWKHPIDSMTSIFGGFKEDKKTGLSEFDIWQSAKYANISSVDDAIIRTDGSVIKTNPKDTLVALKDIPLSMEQVRNDTTKNLNTSLSNLGNDKTLEKKLATIIDVLSKILAKDIQVNLPPQTRSDLDIIMSGGMI